jgi:hypothetical protein
MNQNHNVNIYQFFSSTLYTWSIPNIRDTFLILSCIFPICPPEQLQLVGVWTLQGVESVPQGCWPIWTPLLPTVVPTWLNVLWVVDHSWYTRETVEHDKSSSVAVFDTNRCQTYPIQRHLNILSYPFTLWMAFYLVSLCHEKSWCP